MEAEHYFISSSVSGPLANYLVRIYGTKEQVHAIAHEHIPRWFTEYKPSERDRLVSTWGYKVVGLHEALLILNDMKIEELLKRVREHQEAGVSMAHRFQSASFDEATFCAQTAAITASSEEEDEGFEVVDD